ncbi:uncharacterized protein LOC111047788 isoform X2 [Nilaparvata lugens]|uniref:uncharacterized protein LOC111047788 isoform X2 n=1 Tax=Nilaparvata lugens TaxID=108931 RepID=UPI00193CBE9F|nr:uncharacterized protein LOC111047788 isoform X2 [Nilaparvata lugens]
MTQVRASSRLFTLTHIFQTFKLHISDSESDRFAYRMGKLQPESEKMAQGVCTLAWWWFLWHIWHDYDMITGEFPNLFPQDWTDEELGIPPEK